jgi:O-antigen/teichoic acid export membrane protein
LNCQLESNGIHEKLWAEKVLKSILTVLTGSLLGQAIALAAMPILSRIYTAESFGQFQVYMAILNVLLMIVAFRYEVAMLSATAGEEYSGLLRLILRLIVVTSCITFLVVVTVYALSESIIKHSPALLLMLAPAMFIGGINQMATYLPMRNQNYTLSAKSKIFQSIGYVVAAFAAYITPLASMGLILADIVGRLFSTLSIFRGSPGTASELTKRISGEHFRELAHKFRKFPLFTFPGTLISSLSATLLPLVFVKVYGFEVAGQYALIERVILLPVAVIAGASMQVFTGDFSENLRNPSVDLNSLFRKVLRNHALLAVLPCLLGMFLLPTLIPIVFGENWQLAGRLGAIAMPIAFMNFVVQPLTMTLIMCDKQWLQIGWEIFRPIVMILSFAPLYFDPTTTPETALMFFTAAVVLVYAVFLLLAERATRQFSGEKNKV